MHACTPHFPGPALAVNDQSTERLTQWGPTRGPRLQIPDELLPLVDVVSVAVPTSSHYAVARACLLAGKHVLVEKPIAVTMAEAQELVRLAEDKHCRLQVGHSERFNPVMQLMRPHIGRPVFIECHRLSSFSERGTDVDVILDLMIHDLDMVLSFNRVPLKTCRLPVYRSSRRRSTLPMLVSSSRAVVSRTSRQPRVDE